MSDFTASGLVIGVLAMLFFTPGMFCKGILTISNEELTGGQKVLCFIPIVNIFKTEKEYWGKLWLISYSIIVMVLSIIAKFATWYFMHSNVTLNLVTTILVLVAVAFMFIANAIGVWTIIRDTDATSTGKAIFFSVLFPIGQYFVGSYVPTIVSKSQNKEATFNT